MVKMMFKSKSTTDILTQTLIAVIDIWNSLHKHNRTEMKTVESFDKHSTRLSLPFFYTVTEEK